MTLDKNFAFSSLGLGLIGIFFSLSLGIVMLAPLFVIASLVFGIMALKKIKEAPKKYGGRVMAWIGIVLSAVSIVIMLLWIVVLNS
ncbi:MAG: DUF4190 domain-containing protein [archaeon]